MENHFDISELRRRRRKEKPNSIITNGIILSEMESFLATHYSQRRGERVLDLGAGTKPYAPLYSRFFAETRSTDVEASLLDTRAVDVILNPGDPLPFASEWFDCVICTEVLEHCQDPSEMLGEIYRVLCPGGLAFLTTPFLVPLHDMPFDYYRFTPPALRDLTQRGGFEMISLRPRGEYCAVAITLLQLPMSKMWRLLSRAFGRDLAGARNPAAYLTIHAPQLAYLALWRRMQNSPRSALRRLHDRLAYYTLGYVTVVRRPSTH